MVRWDVFISHAAEDKEAVARPLADLLAAKGLFVWLDENEIKLGDSLREKIDLGLSRSRFGIVILSPAFLAKRWTISELNALIALETRQRKVILPIWHGLTRDDIARHSPLLADKRAVATASGLDAVVADILDAAAWSRQEQPKVHEPFAAGKWSAEGADYLALDADPESLGATIAFPELREEEVATVKPKELAALASSCWAYAFSLLATFIGRRPSDITFGRTHIRRVRLVDSPGHYIVERTAAGLTSAVSEWEAVNLIVHFRNWYSGRDIDYDTFDLFVAAYETYTGGYTPTAHNDSIRRRIVAMKPTISRKLAPVAAWAVREKNVRLIVGNPEWVRNSMPVTGGDAYRLRCIITDQPRSSRALR